MESNLKREDLLIKLRAKLNEEKIKLWEPPYYDTDTGSNTNSLQELGRKYAEILSQDYRETVSALQELQMHSVDRFTANVEFKETGVATLRVKVSLRGEKPRQLNIQKKLSELGSDLVMAISHAINVQVTRVKIIFNGRVLKPTESLEQQGIKNGSLMMALIMAESPEDSKNKDTMYMEMKKTRDDAMLLSESVGVDDFVQIEDQSGAEVQLPAAERRSLLAGLALHERGRTAMREGDHSLALLLMLEADEQFSTCSSSLLKQVDNWAVLQLDIVWCYVCLHSLNHVSDAERRLSAAEDAFVRSYGESQQRLIALKGTNSNERVLFMRLHLLQGIVAYHQNKRADAKRLLEAAEQEINSLRVDESAVDALVAGGWARAAARGALRAAGEPKAAIQLLTERREQAERARHESRLRRQRRTLGICDDGRDVSPSRAGMLAALGFGRRGIRALRVTNNDIDAAMSLLSEGIEPPMGEGSTSEESDSSDDFEEADENLVSKLQDMGYDPNQARIALKLFSNQLGKAADFLVAGNGRAIQDESLEHPSTSSGTGSRKRKSNSSERSNKRKEREAALQRLAEDIKTEEEDYLDTSLTQEEELLAQYKSLI